MSDPFDLQRFVGAQDAVMDRVRAELRNGRKTSHWMWFVFPQLAGLGNSAMSRRYAIASRAEAAAYLAHPVLGPRMEECCRLLLGLRDFSAHDIFGSPDDMKLRSCMTLFAEAAGGGVFAEVLARFFAGEIDRAILDRLR